MNIKHSKILVIGAGMAGLTCAARLAQAGHDITVVDKGRGPGGRMAARRAEIAGETVSFDHGAQYFTARDPGFVKVVEAWESARVVARWVAAGADAWVGAPGMNAPIRAMAEPLNVEWSARIEKIERSGAGWSVQLAEDSRSFDKVLIAVPAEQAAVLLANAASDLAATPASVVSEPCWAVMAAFGERLAIEADSVRDPQAAISWAARNSSKPGRAGDETWVLHASPERSREIIDLSKEEVGAALLADFFAQTGIAPTGPVHIAAHRWLYAQPRALGGEPARYDAAAGIGIAGDYLHSPRVEGAWVSGTALAELVLAA